MAPKNRLELQDLLTDILGSDDVYYQPPETLKMSYPCIVYNLRNVEKTEADNKVYRAKKLYDVILISRDADDDIFDMLLYHSDPMFQLRTRYVTNNLYHDVFTTSIK